MKAPSRICLRPPVVGDAREFLRLARASRGMYGAWGRPPMTPTAFLEFVARGERDDFVSRFVCLKGSGAIVGCITLGNIVRRMLQSGYLGYYTFVGHEGKGYMTEGMGQILRLAFREEKLHRVEANIQPGNARSIALVERCGFRFEGYSRRYLKIAGRWRDHERWALLREDWRSGHARS